LKHILYTVILVFIGGCSTGDPTQDTIFFSPKKAKHSLERERSIARTLEQKLAVERNLQHEIGERVLEEAIRNRSLNKEADTIEADIIKLKSMLEKVEEEINLVRVNSSEAKALSEEKRHLHVLIGEKEAQLRLHYK